MAYGGHFSLCEVRCCQMETEVDIRRDLLFCLVRTCTCGTGPRLCILPRIREVVFQECNCVVFLEIVFEPGVNIATRVEQCHLS
jgi:hypothetical protein